MPYLEVLLKEKIIFGCSIIFHGPSNWQSWCRNPPLWGTM